jgi:hypothetical protein
MNPTRRLPLNRSHVGEWLDGLRGHRARAADGAEWPRIAVKS